MKKIITIICGLVALVAPLSSLASISFRPYITVLENQVSPGEEIELSAYNSFLAGGEADDYTYKWEIASAPSGYTGEMKASGTGMTSFSFTPNAVGNYIVELVLVNFSGTSSIANYVTITALPFNEAFTDLPERHWARNYFYELYYAGVMTGYEDGTLRPEDTINRVEFLAMCMRAFAMANDESVSELVPSQMDTYFADVESDEWYYTYLAKAVEEEIVSGYIDDTFRPDNNVSLAESLKIAINFTNIVPEARTVNIMKISDVGQDDWYAKYISAAIDEGIIEVANYLNPNQAITRAEAAQIIHETFFGKNAKLVSWNYLAQ